MWEQSVVGLIAFARNARDSVQKLPYIKVRKVHDPLILQAFETQLLIAISRNPTIDVNEPIGIYDEFSAMDTLFTVAIHQDKRELFDDMMKTKRVNISQQYCLNGGNALHIAVAVVSVSKLLARAV